MASQYSSKIKSEVYDQSGRAQELAVSVADPPTATSSIETGTYIEFAQPRLH